MPGSTPEYGFPYPIGADPLGDGDDRVQELAEAVEAVIAAQHQLVVKSTNEDVTSSTTYQADDELEFPVSAGGVYLVDFMFLWRSAAAASGIKIRWNAPAGAAVYGRSITQQFTADPINALGIQGDIAGDLLIAFGSEGAGIGGSDAVMHTAGTHRMVLAGTGGTAKVQWAQSTSHGTATRMLSGSWLKIAKVY